MYLLSFVVMLVTGWALYAAYKDAKRAGSDSLAGTGGFLVVALFGASFTWTIAQTVDYIYWRW